MITEDMTAAEKAADWIDQFNVALVERNFTDEAIRKIVVAASPTIVRYFLNGE